jgi:hypothetical protein
MGIAPAGPESAQRYTVRSTGLTGEEEAMTNQEATYDITRAEVSETCDGMFLLWDTAAHLGNRPTDREIREHIAECEQCSEINAGL